MKIICAIMALFLSSAAATANTERSHAALTSLPDTTEGLFQLPVLGTTNMVDSSGLSRTAFEKTPEQNGTINYIVAWPRLMSNSEVQIKMAEDRLKVFVARHEAEERRRLRLQYDWDRFWMATGLGLMLIGLMLFTIGYGNWRDLTRERV